MTVKIRAGKNVVYWRVGDKVLATTQRSASAAMAEALGPAGTPNCGVRLSLGNAALMHDEQDAEIVIWIREPLERMVCAYDIWHQAHTPLEFCHKVLTERNAHWSPTTMLHHYRGGFLPTKVYAFEDLNETWPLEFPKHTLRKLGGRDRMGTEEFMEHVSPAMYEQLIEHYESDIVLHNMAKQHPGLFYAEVAA